MNFGFLLIRIVVGLTMASHGAQKLFGWFGGSGVKATGSMMESIGFPSGNRFALLAGLGEFGGGLLLALGLVQPLASAAIIAVMLVAIGSLHFEHGFFNTKGGFEYNLVLCAAALGLALTGPGRYSLDAVMGIHWRGVPGGLFALGVGIIAAEVPLIIRHRRLQPQGPSRTTGTSVTTQGPAVTP